MNLIRHNFLSVRVQMVLSMATFAIAVFLFLSTTASTPPADVLSAFQTNDVGLKIFIIFGMALLFPAAISILVPESYKEKVGSELHLDQNNFRDNDTADQEVFPIAFEFAPAADRQKISQRVQVSNLLEKMTGAAGFDTACDTANASQSFSNTESIVTSGIAQLEATQSLYENCDLMFRCIHLHGLLAFSRSSIDSSMAATSYERAFALYQMCEELHPEETKHDSHEIMIYLLLKRYSALLEKMNDATSSQRLAAIKTTLDLIRARRLSTVVQQKRSDHGTPTFLFQKPQALGTSTRR